MTGDEIPLEISTRVKVAAALDTAWYNHVPGTNNESVFYHQADAVLALLRAGSEAPAAHEREIGGALW